MKSDISGTSKPTPPIVFNLQASDWVPYEEETGVHTQLSQNTYKLIIFFNVYFAKNKICAFQKIP